MGVSLNAHAQLTGSTNLTFMRGNFSDSITIYAYIIYMYIPIHDYQLYSYTRLELYS